MFKKINFTKIDELHMNFIYINIPCSEHEKAFEQHEQSEFFILYCVEGEFYLK